MVPSKKDKDHSHEVCPRCRGELVDPRELILKLHQQQLQSAERERERARSSLNSATGLPSPSVQAAESPSI